MPYNPYNLRNQKWGPVLVGLAGPASNFLMAAIFLGLLRMMVFNFAFPPQNLAVMFFVLLATVNIVLGVFNLLPIPPLDGSRLSLRLGLYTESFVGNIVAALLGALILLFIVGLVRRS